MKMYLPCSNTIKTEILMFQIIYLLRCSLSNLCCEISCVLFQDSVQMIAMFPQLKQMCKKDACMLVYYVCQGGHYMGSHFIFVVQYRSLQFRFFLCYAPNHTRGSHINIALVLEGAVLSGEVAEFRLCIFHYQSHSAVVLILQR